MKPENYVDILVIAVSCLNVYAARRNSRIAKKNLEIFERLVRIQNMMMGIKDENR
jgi:hypothetical protein